MGVGYMIGQTLGHYEILSNLGAGGMGEVYRARDIRLGREVALKILPSHLARDPKRRARFQREARTIAALKHPNIVTIHSVEDADGLPFLTMELVEGIPLSEAIPPRGLPLERFLQLAIPLVDAVRCAHEKGITHRDLKPHNVMVEADQLKILDFGLAKSFVQGEDLLKAKTREEKHETQEGDVLGTAGYMAPEQARGELVDHRSDIFSLGIILYEMLTGKHPFTGATGAEVISSILRDRPPLASDVATGTPRRLAEIVDRCLEKSPEHRTQTAKKLYDDIQSVSRKPGSAAVEPSPSIAVLPFADLSPEKDQDYFCEGIAEELINNLAKIRGLHVASRTSAFKYKNAAQDIRDIGRELGVGTMLEGSVRKAGDRVRIHAQLIDVADGYHLWSERYDRNLEDIFAIEDEIAGRIVQALRIALSPGERRFLKSVSTMNVEAYDYYLRGRKSYYEFRRRSIDLALQMFTLAIKHDPRYALAYAGIADCCSFLYSHVDRSRETLKRADEASRKALELDPQLAEAHVSRGQAFSLAGNHEQAEKEFQKALELDPWLFEAHYLYARDCFTQGRMEKAAELFERAADILPDDYQSPLLVAQIYVSQGRKEDAGRVRRRGVEIAEARLKSNPQDIRALYMGANGLVALGDVERGLEWAQLAMSYEPTESIVLYNLGCIYSLAGEPETAIETLERAMEAGLTNKGWYEHDGDLEPLRGHPRFRALLERLG